MHSALVGIRMAKSLVAGEVGLHQEPRGKCQEIHPLQSQEDERKRNRAASRAGDESARRGPLTRRNLLPLNMSLNISRFLAGIMLQSSPGS